MGSILVVDDERSMREFLAICLRREGHKVAVADSGASALESLEQEARDIVITDFRMPGDIDGLGLLHEIQRRSIDSDVIIVTAFATTDTAIAAMKDGAYDYLTKPFKVDDINAVIARAMERRALVKANAALREQVAGRFRLAQLVGKSQQMQKVFELIGKIHSTRTSVLITGESGTGKELVARALHSEGSRKENPLITVNCGAIPESLMESELFGHMKGSFTGAIADKRGMFHEAGGGILFLDEIGEMSLNLQVKLLRAVQERKVKPIGAAQEEAIDVRVIAATNRDLGEEVERGAFRQDLYYRLNVIEIRLPPLRQRREDIPLLIELFLQRITHEQGKQITGLSPAALRKLSDYDYPGNIRELENLIERAVTLCSDSCIDVDVLPELRNTPKVGNEDTQSLIIPEEGINLEGMVNDYERAIVQQALQQSDGVRKRAARLLGISFRSLRYRMEKLGLDA